MEERKENFVRRALRSIYSRALDGIILLGLALIFFGAVGVYLYDVFRGQTPPAGGDLLTLLGVVLAILGLGGTAIYLWIYRKVDEQIKKEWAVERSLSRSDINRVLGVFYMSIYETVFCKATSSEDQLKYKNEAWDYLEGAIIKSSEALESLEKITDEECLRERLLGKNNTAHSLARKWEYLRDKKDDIAFKNYLEETLERTSAYITDKNLAERYIMEANNIEHLQKSPDLIAWFKMTSQLVEKTFKINPTIPAE